MTSTIPHRGGQVRHALIGTLLIVGAAGQQIAAQEGPRAPGDFTLSELLAVSSPLAGGVPDWSPDGSRILMLGDGRLRILEVATGGVTELPLSDASNAAYSPDGRSIAYMAPGPEGGQELWLWLIAERRAVQLTDLGVRMNSWSWAPDGRRIAFSSILRGSFDIYTVEVPDGAIRRLTAHPLYDVQPSWTPDSRTILFVRLDERWVDHEVVAIDAATGAGARTIVRDQDFFDYRVGWNFGPAHVSPNGDLVLFRSNRSGWINWWVVPLEGGEPRPLAAEAADQSAQNPFRGWARWSPDGRHVAYTSNLNGTQVLRVTAVEDGVTRTLVEPDLGVASNPAWSPDGTHLTFTLDEPRRPLDLHVVEVASGITRRLTHTLADTSLTTALFTPEKIHYESEGGYTIPAYLYRPAGAVPPGGHPAIVWVHGGPTSQFDDSWGRHWEAQYYIRHGYAVLMPNIRGSAGYGLSFEKANAGCWGRCDMEDLTAGVEYLRTLPDIDGERVAVTGTSYGGYMSIAATTFAGGVFRASAATVSGYVDRLRWAEEVYDIAGINLMAYDLGPVESNRETYRYVSPFHFAREMDTPLLIVGAEGDTPMRPFADEARRYFKPVRYEGYPDVGGSEARATWMPRVLAFFDRHLRPDLEIRPPR